MGCRLLYRKGLCGLCDTQLQKSVSCIFFVLISKLFKGPQIFFFLGPMLTQGRPCVEMIVE